MKIKPLKIPTLYQNEPCVVCGSGRLLRDCCLMRDGTLRILPPDLRPASPPSHMSCDGCYLSFTDDCSSSLTGEHYMSKSVLKQLGDVSISGAPWQAPGTSKQIGINALTAKILCGRHNSQLSVLDDTARLFFQRLDDVWVDMGRRSLATKPIVTFASGETFERWMLKVFCGTFYSKIASANRQRIIDTHSFDERALFNALLANEWLPNCGLYLKPGKSILPENKVSVAPLSMAGTDLVVGIEMNFRGMNFRAIFDARFVNVGILAAEGWKYRVSQLRFVIQKRNHLIILTWPLGTPSNPIISYAAPLTTK